MPVIPSKHNTISNGKIISSKTIADDKINKLSGRIAALEEKTSTISPHLGTLLHNIEGEILNLTTETHRLKMEQKNMSEKVKEIPLFVIACSLLTSVSITFLLAFMLKQYIM